MPPESGLPEPVSQNDYQEAVALARSVVAWAKAILRIK